MTDLARYLAFPPQADESARGLVVRLAESNVFSSAQMCDWLGLPRIDTEFLDPAEPSRKAGIDPDAFAAMGFSNGETETFLGHPVPRKMAMRHVMRVCPACLADSPYHRRIWDHQQLEACPIHKVMLLDRCPECTEGGRIRWGRRHLLSGDCKHDLAQQPAESAGACTGTAAIYRHCGLTCEGSSLPPAFADLPLQALLDLLFFLGRTDILVAQGNPDELYPRRAWSDGTVLDAGVRIALGWPNSFGDLAERVRATYPDVPGVMAQYGYLHRFIMKCGGAPFESLLRSAYAAHLAKRGDVSSAAWPTFLPKPTAAASTLSTLAARRLLGLGWKSFSALKGEPLWADLKPLMSGRNGTPQFNRDDVLALGVKLARLVSPYVADEALGTSQGKVSQLLDAKLLPVHRWNRNHKNGEQRSVDLADVGALFGKLERLCLPVAPGKPVTFTTMLRMAANRRVIEFPDVIRCLLAGQLRGYMPPGAIAKCSSMVFEKADATEVLNRLGSPARSGKMYLRDVSRKLKIPGKAVHELVAAKLLAAPERKSAYVFDADAVEWFWDEFTYDTALARTKHTRPSEIRKALALIGIRPVTTITMQKAVTAAVYRKADLQGLY
jgi:hypothetical protein